MKLSDWVNRQVTLIEVAALSTVVLLLPVAGCGGSDRGLVEVKGTLTLDGAPLPQQSVFFTPVGGTPGHGGGGFTDANGAFTIKAVVPGALEDFDGLVPGEYRVTVREPRVTAATSDTARDESFPAPALAPDTVKKSKARVPSIYSGENSPITINVPAEGGDFPVEVSSR